MYTPSVNMDKYKKTITPTEAKQPVYTSSLVKQYTLPVSAILFIFGTTVNVLLIIIIICKEDMRTVPNMYILNLAISDIIYLTVLFCNAWPNIVTWISGDMMCIFFPFWYRMSAGLTVYSLALLSIQRYRVTVNPLQVRVSSKPTWRTTGATICGVWIMASLCALPSARSRIFCSESIFFGLRIYYQKVIF
jgi:hypothetical protein